MKPNYSKYKFNTTELSSKNIINYCFGFRNVVIPTYNYDTRIFNLNHVRIIYKYIYICICIFNIGTHVSYMKQITYLRIILVHRMGVSFVNIFVSTLLVIQKL